MAGHADPGAYGAGYVRCGAVQGLSRAKRRPGISLKWYFIVGFI